MVDYGKPMCQHLADLSGESVTNIRMGKLSKMYGKAVKSRKEAEEVKSREDHYNMPQVEYLKKLVAQEIEKCAEETDSSLPLISVFDALQIVKAHKDREMDLGLRALTGHLETAWRGNREAVITAGSYLKLKDHYTRQYPKSKVAHVFDSFQDEGYMDLPVGELMGIVAQIETQSDYDYLIRDYGLDGNKPWQRKARQFIVAAINGDDISKEGQTSPFEEEESWIVSDGNVFEEADNWEDVLDLVEDWYDYILEQREDIPEDYVLPSINTGRIEEGDVDTLNIRIRDWENAIAESFEYETWAGHGNYSVSPASEMGLNLTVEESDSIEASKRGQTSPFEEEEVEYSLSPENEEFLQQILHEKDEMPDQMYGVEDFDWEEEKEEGCDRKKSQINSKALEWGQDHMPYADFEKTGDVEYTITVGGKRIGYLDDVSDIGNWYGPSGQESEFWGVFADYENVLRQSPELMGEGTLSEEDVYGKESQISRPGADYIERPISGKSALRADVNFDELIGFVDNLGKKVCTECANYDSMTSEWDGPGPELIEALDDPGMDYGLEGDEDCDYCGNPLSKDTKIRTSKKARMVDIEDIKAFMDQHSELVQEALKRGFEDGWGYWGSANNILVEMGYDESEFDHEDMSLVSDFLKEMYGNPDEVYEDHPFKSGHDKREAQNLNTSGLEDPMDMNIDDIKNYVLGLLEKGYVEDTHEALRYCKEYIGEDDYWFQTMSRDPENKMGRWVTRGIMQAFDEYNSSQGYDI